MAQDQWFDNQSPREEPEEEAEITVAGSVSGPRQDAGLKSRQKALGLSKDQGEPLDSNPNRENVWNDQNLLTFDGGGIRGYWSLLVLLQLMDHIFKLEMNPRDIPLLRYDRSLHERNYHSFHPQDYPENVSHVRRSPQERRFLRVQRPEEALDPARRYLPCHYFDFIGGTSTGALISIMLGRLRMTVLDCLNEYARLGDVIFGHPVKFGSARMLMGIGTKLRTSKAEEAYEGVVKRYGEDKDKDRYRTRWKSARHMCNTFVTAAQRKEGSGVQMLPNIIRSYRSPKHRVSNPQVLPLGKTISGEDDLQQYAASQPNGGRQEYEDAPDLDLLQVARAATAATGYHKPQKIMTPRDGIRVFEDAGLLEPNPTPRGIEEIKRIFGPGHLGVVVSIGTAKADLVQEKQTGAGHAQRWAASILDPDKDNAKLEDELPLGTPYFRLNPSKAQPQTHRTTVGMTEWEPKGSWRSSQPGSETLRKLKTKFDTWYGSSDEIKQQFQRCAEQLVGRRRLRAQDRDKWERYVVGCTFRCPDRTCSNEDKFFSREKLVRHCTDKHPERRMTTDQAKRHDEWRYPSPQNLVDYFIV